MNSHGAALITNGSATGSAVAWAGGHGVLVAEGTFGGASLTMQYQGPNGTWLDVKVMDGAGVQTTMTLTAAGMFVFALPPGSVRAVLTGGTPSAMYVRADRVTV